MSGRIRLRTWRIRHEHGHCHWLPLPRGIGRGDSTEAPYHSQLTIFENGMPLGPAHSLHQHIREHGGGRFSHWGDGLFFSTSDNSDPRRNARRYEIDRAATPTDPPLFPRLERLRHHITQPSIGVSEPTGKSLIDRLRLLEAKTEYLLDENYRLKSVLRDLMSESEVLRTLTRYQTGTFDYKWRQAPAHTWSMTDPAWRESAVRDVTSRLDVDAQWFNGKTILDCGCGAGRYTWAFARLGSQVTAFDLSETGLHQTAKECVGLPQVELHKCNILEPLPFSKTFDLVWCYGVIHHTVNPFRALVNIAAQVAPGGLLYLMVYAEPRRDHVDDYRYYHEVYSLRQSINQLDYERQFSLMSRLDGEAHAVSWFDAVSSEINELYTEQELRHLLGKLGFADIKRTLPEERNLNVVARKPDVDRDPE